MFAKLLIALFVTSGAALGAKKVSPCDQPSRERTENALKDQNWRSPEGFQNLTWGMTKDEVMAKTPGIQVSPNGGLMLLTQMVGRVALISYDFMDNRLSYVSILFDGVKNPKIEVAQISNLLKLKYGSPNYPSEDHYVGWCTKETEINLRLDPGVDGVQVIYVSYMSNAMRYGILLEHKQNQQRLASEL